MLEPSVPRPEKAMLAGGMVFAEETGRSAEVAESRLGDKFKPAASYVPGANDGVESPICCRHLDRSMSNPEVRSVGLDRRVALFVVFLRQKFVNSTVAGC